MTKLRSYVSRAAMMAPLVLLTATGWTQPAQPAAGRGQGGGRGPAIVSPEVLPDARVVFRIAAPRAESVTLNGGDIPGLGGQGGTPAQFVKKENGIWEATVGPVTPGAFRYVYQVDGVRTLDPVNPRVSESNANCWSLFFVPGLEFMETRDVPHGAVASVYYQSAVLKTTRRMHIYTPPGYEVGQQKYPVFYLLHGASDSDDSWTSVGRAGFILDNLIAAGKAKPMIVVMTAGHQPAIAAGAPPAPAAADQPPPFTREFVTDVMPYVEKHYRTIADRSHRAIAGLSMGGSQTLDIAFRNLKDFAYIGVFSSGASLGGGRGPTAGAAPQPPRPDWEAVHKTDLDNAALKKGTKRVWLSTGLDDGLIANSRTTTELLKKHGFNAVFKESPGGHTWLNWRNYLSEFAPQLFQ
ncbi:MAG: alpha/beta hydrolase-fold protein [Candidatus Solibacter sp.]|nr:alpha/beta hydrolase-fold protein [Candidatus Solibacter sp.]